MLQGLKLIEKIFMTGKCFITYFSVVCLHFVLNLPVVIFDGLLEIVNVDELDVELIVEVFNLQKIFFKGLVGSGVLELEF